MPNSQLCTTLFPPYCFSTYDQLSANVIVFTEIGLLFQNVPYFNILYINTYSTPITLNA